MRKEDALFILYEVKTRLEKEENDYKIIEFLEGLSFGHKSVIGINVYSLLTYEGFEKLEEDIRKLFEKEHIKATVYNEVTGSLLRIGGQ